MKVLIITDLYPPYFVGGYELKCKLHADELTRRGHMVSILTSNWMAGKENIAEENVSRSLQTIRESRSPYVQKKSPITNSLRKRYSQMKRMFACRENYRVAYDTILAMNPDLVYAWQLNDVSITPVLAAQDQGVPTVFRVDDYWLSKLKKEICLDSNPLKRQYRSMINGLQDFNSIDFSHMLVISRSVKKSYVKVGFPAANLTVMPEGVLSDIVLDIDELPDSRAKDCFRLVYVGRLVHQKGTHVALESLWHLVKEMGISNIHLDIIGIGPSDYVEQLRNMVAEFGLNTYVKFVGFMEHEQILARFLEYSAVLIPSLWEEPLSGTIAEAMARGLPIIATDRGGNPEIILDCENGLLVPSSDPLKLAYAIKKLIEDPAMVRRLQRRALETVRENYIHERILDRVEKYFQAMLAAGS
jgi:glycosyltransferase involved in cell wall biosynthesis